jgi:hypothetical protein
MNTIVQTRSLAVPLRQELRPGESVMSLLSRVVETNRYDRVLWLFQKNPKRRFDSGRWNDKTITVLATITGIDRQAFKQACYREHAQPGRLEDQRHVLGSRVPAQLIDFGVQKFCPRCLDEFGFNAALFDLTAIDACPRHAVRLLSVCPNCHAQTPWGRPGVTKCGVCDADLRTAPTTPVLATDIAGTAAIAARAGFPLAAGQPTPYWPDEAAHLDLGESIELLAVLARLATDHRNQDQFLSFPPAEAHLRLQLGYQQLLDWPNGYFRCLDAIADAAPSDASVNKSRHRLFGYARVFGEFYSRLAAAEHEPMLFLKEGFARYSAQQSKVPITGRRDGAVFTADDIADRPVITKKEAAAILDVGYYTSTALLRAGALPTKANPAGAHERRFILRTDVEALAEGGGPAIKKDAAEILGIPHMKLTKLIAQGCIKPLIGPEIDGMTHYAFARRDLAALIAGIRARLIVDPAYTGNTGFATVMRGQETLRVSAKPVLDAMSSGELPLRAVDDNATGLAAFRFNNREVDRFLHLRHDVELGDRQGLTGLRVSHVLRVNPMTVTWLLKKGALRLGTGATNKKPTIERASLEAYQRDCIVIFELQQSHHTNSTIVANALKTAGVQPLYDVDDAYGIFVYDRAKVAKLDTGNLIRGVGRVAGRSKAEYKRILKAEGRIGSRSTR